MGDWLNIPVKERIGLLREYKKLGYSYSSAKKDFEDGLQKLQSGGLLETFSMLSAQETPQNNLGMTGMMKGTIAREAHFGNPAAQRMVSPNPKTGMTPEGQGTHYMGSYGKYAIPKLQDTGQDSLQYYPNKPPLKEAIRFNSEREAEYFAENYKDVAPMMRSLPKYEGGGGLSKPIPYQQPASSTNVVGRNPMYEMQLMKRDQLRQNLFQQASQGSPEAEQQFRETFGTSTHRYRYDNDPQYREQTQTNMREHTGSRIDYSSTDLRREGNITPNTAWMYPQLQGKGKQAMTEFSNQVIEVALPIPLLESMGKIPSISKAIKRTGKIANKVDDIVRPVTSSVDDVGKGFKSEIDWGKWNKEIPNNKALMKEYEAIEKTSKTNGTWMKNPDGSVFKGTPEQFVQQNSENFKKAFPNVLRDETGNVQKTYHGSQNTFDFFDPNIMMTGRTRGKGIYTSPIKERAATYATKGDKKLYEFYQNASNPQLKLEEFNKASDIRFNKFLQENPKGSKDFDKKFDEFMKNENKFFDKLTDEEYFKLQPGYDFYKAAGDEYVVPFTNYPKSAIGNNGMFDMTNPNIYKGLIPPAIGLVVGSQYLQEKEFGGVLPMEPLKRRRR